MHGINCEVEENECASNPCVHGTCQVFTLIVITLVWEDKSTEFLLGIFFLLK